MKTQKALGHKDHKEYIAIPTLNNLALIFYRFEIENHQNRAVERD